ncbi:hypothetical protein PABY_11890 [Pyrodictium abyssi]|uniref:Uncharacterized protein n=1 Tax=Pyrodictium abyssi TaxID=54256 RepID=A0ABN6ZTS1_9CREN|nr:hypothetical protein PABY_11890 [Pyrodictium abyssi]
MTGCEAYQVVSAGLMLALPGLALALVADRLEQNPLIGFRVGYTFTSREAWVKANRVSGVVLAATGLAAMAVGLVWGFMACVIALVVLPLVALPLLVSYASRTAEKALIGEEQPLEPPAGELPRPRYPVLAAVVPILGLAACAMAAAGLLEEGMPAAAVVVGLEPFAALYLAYLSLARPEAYHQPWLEPGEVAWLATLVPVSAGLASMASAALVAGYAAAGAALLALSLAHALAAAWITMRAYTQRQRRATQPR